MNDHIKIVESKLIIRGDRELINKFITDNKGKTVELSFDKGVPLPQDISKEAYIKWALSNWGTMGEPIKTTEWVIDKETALLEISTHWSPPTLYLLNVSNDYPELTFSLLQQPETEHSWVDAIYVRNGIPVDDFEDLHWEWVAETLEVDEDPYDLPHDMRYETPAYMSGNPGEYETNLNRGGGHFYNCYDCQQEYDEYIEREYEEQQGVIPQEDPKPMFPTSVSTAYSNDNAPF